MSIAGIHRPEQKARLRRMCALVASVSILTLLAGCADPWVDRRREAGEPHKFVGTSTDDLVSVCHAGQPTAEVQRLAVQECARTKRTPVFVGTLRYQCPLTAPNLSVFDCK
ncbi:hypothetical protein [Novispirillum itersonii]|uniref:hypothetical protein n=1 Tax=Novispirillum itersonii TaxID=189 RepID=UPI00035D56DE|nr:hypothetical protein [Novispirillum itersonii]